MLRTGGNGQITGANPWRWNSRQKFRNPYVQEHMDLIESIRLSKGLNEAHRIATSTLTAVMGRIAPIPAASSPGTR